MATSSYPALFGTNGAGQQGSQAGIGTLFGQQPRPRQQQQQQAPQTFAQMQQQGQARPAPMLGAQRPQPPMLRQLQQQLQPMPGGGQQVTERQTAVRMAPQIATVQAQPRPGEVAYRGQPGQTPAFDQEALARAMQQRQQMAAQRPPQPQPAPGAEPQGMLTAEQAGSTFLTKYAGGYSPAELQQMQQAQQAQQEMQVSAPPGGMEMMYSQAQPQTAEQQQQMLAQTRSTATPETQALMQQATSLGLDANAAMMNPEGFRQYLTQQGMTPATPQAPSQTSTAFESLLGQLQQQLGQQFAQPSGYTSEEFQQLRAAQTGQLQAEFGAQQQALNEELARRGLSASSIGAGRMGDLAGQQARAMAGLEAQLLQQQAEMGQRGRESALGTLAQVTGQLGQLGLGQQEVGLRAAEIAQKGEQFGLQLNEQQAERLQRFGISTQELGLRAQELQQQARTQGRELDIREAQNLAQNELEGRRIEQQQGQFTEQLRFNREELALRGDLGRAEQAMAERRLQQEGRLEESRQAIQLKELGQREAQFQATLGAEEQRFVRTLKEQQEARLQQLGISTKELDLRATQIADEARLRGDEIGLTRARDEAEIEYRGKALEQQELLAGRQITAEAARQQAQLDFQRDQMTTEDALRREGIAVDRERLAAAESQFTRQLAQQSAEAAGKVRVGTRFVQQPDGSTVEEPIYEDTVQARQLAQQQRMQEAELKGYFEGPNGTRIDTLATRQLDQARLNALAEQAARQSQLTGFMYKVNKLGQLEIERGADGKPVTTEARRAQMQQEEQAKLDRELRERLGMGELTGVIGTGPGAQQTLAARNAQQNMLIQLAAALSQSTNIKPDDLTKMMKELYAKLGTGGNPLNNLGDTSNDAELERIRGRQAAPTGTPQIPPRGTPAPQTTTTTTTTGRSGRRGG